MKSAASLLAVLLTGLGTVISAEESAVQVRYLSTRAWQHEDMIVVQGAFEISGPAHRWYDVYYQLRLSEQEPLRAPGKDGMSKLWDNLFTPESPNPVRWSECRGGFTLAEVAAAENLPKGAKTRIWAVCDLWDQAAKEYVGSGWSVAAPIDLETDAQGKITSVACPGEAPPAASGSWKIPGMWSFTFPGGTPYGTCSFAEEGHWAWSIYEGSEVTANSQGTWTLEGNRLTLSHEDGTKQEFTLEWVDEKKLLLRKGDTTLTFTR